jgi:1-acyl-sn-glycerol-3-phosphate acyltransferase
MLHLVYLLVKYLFYGILHIFFSKIKVIGLENIPVNGAVLFVGVLII